MTSFLRPPLMPYNSIGFKLGKLDTHLFRFARPMKWTALLPDSRFLGALNLIIHLHDSAVSLMYCGVCVASLSPSFLPVPHCSFKRCSGHAPWCSPMDSNGVQINIRYFVLVIKHVVFNKFKWNRLINRVMESSFQQIIIVTSSLYFLNVKICIGFLIMAPDLGGVPGKRL